MARAGGIFDWSEPQPACAAMRRERLKAQSLNHVHATNIQRICGRSLDMRRFATVALTTAAALGALLLALWLDATATPPVI